MNQNNMSYGYVTASGSYPNVSMSGGYSPFTGTIVPYSAASVTSGGTGVNGGWIQYYPPHQAMPDKKEDDPIKKLMEFMVKDKEDRMARERADREDERRRMEAEQKAQKEMFEMMKRDMQKGRDDAATRIQEKIMEQMLNGKDTEDDFKDPTKFETWSDIRGGTSDTIDGKIGKAQDTKSSLDEILMYKMLFGDDKKKEEERENRERMECEIKRLQTMLEKEKEMNAYRRAEERTREREDDRIRFEIAMREQDRAREKALESDRISFDRFRMELQAKQASEILNHKYKLKSSLVTGFMTLVTAVVILGALAFGVIATKEYELKMLKLNKGVETSQGK
jgi:hypothetical protein